MAGSADGEDRSSRTSRASMRRMVRFRMSASASSDNDPVQSLNTTPLNQVVPRSCASGCDSSETLSCREADERSARRVSLHQRPGEASSPQSQSVGCGSTGILVQQVSRFSVMQTPLAETVTSSFSEISNIASSSTSTNQCSEATSNRHSRSRSRRSSHRPSIHDSTTSGSRGSTPEPPPVRISRSRRRRRSRHGLHNVDPEEESRRRHMGIWPHKASGLFAMLATTLGLFNISRFALLTIGYGGNFVIQFLLLTFVFGVPLLCFSACLGQFLGSGAVDMWKISPIFKGVGLSLLLVQALIGVYGVLGVSWMFFYFRDSFIAPEDRYRWDKCFQMQGIRNCSSFIEYRKKPEETIPDYFQGRVLQRTSVDSPPTEFVNLKFEVCFNAAVVWMIVFVALSKGLKSYGKVTHALGTVPVMAYLIVCIKILGMSPSYSNEDETSEILDRTAWNDFFTDTKVWVAAAREVFLTWGLFGAVVMQICAQNRYHHKLRRDIAVVVIITLLVLLMSGYMAVACLNIIYAKKGFTYIPSSFETSESFTFLKHNGRSLKSAESESLYSNFIMGVSIQPDEHRESPYDKSFYQPLRLATEIFPALTSVLGPMDFSPFWAVVFYFCLVAFGISQQLAIWFSVVSGIISLRACCLKEWETTIALGSCALGFALTLPMATELGISIVYFLDYAMGSSWWLMLIYVIQIAAVVIVRGKRHNSESIISVLVRGSDCMNHWCNPLLTFSWNAALPAGLIVLSISSFSVGKYQDLFSWDMDEGYTGWEVWARQSGCMICLVPLLMIPLGGVIQTIRYLRKGPSDLYEKIKLLYRPDFRTYIIRNDRTNQSRGRGHGRSQGQRSRSSSPRPEFADPPPKYTPPPTYNTATGARIAKLFRESIRRIRDLTTPNQTPGNTVTSMAELELGHGSRDDHQISVTATQRSLPPAYTSVILEIVRSTPGGLADLGRRLSEVSDTQCDTPDANNSSVTSTDSTSRLTAAEITRLLFRESFRVNGRQSFRSILRGRRPKSTNDETEEEHTESEFSIPSSEQPEHSHGVHLPNSRDDNHESLA